MGLNLVGDGMTLHAIRDKTLRYPLLCVCLDNECMRLTPFDPCVCL